MANSTTRVKNRTFTTIWYLAVLLGAIVTLVPFVWAVVSSFRPNHVIFSYVSPLSLRTFSPAPYDLEAYVAIFDKGFGRALFNTLFVTATTLGLGLVFNSMAGLAFAKLSFPGKRTLFVLTVITFLVPFRAIAIPLFVLIRDLGWSNSYQALILPATFNGIVILLFRQFFMGIPDDYVDSAKIDGAKWRTIYWRLFVPMSIPAMISAGLILFLEIWLAFLWPLIANPNPRYEVIQVAIARLSTEYGVLWNQQFAATTITTVIPIVVLIALQRHYVRGLTGTEIKG